MQKIPAEIIIQKPSLYSDLRIMSIFPRAEVTPQHVYMYSVSTCSVCMYVYSSSVSIHYGAYENKDTENWMSR